MAGGANKVSLVGARRTYRERRPRTGPGGPRWLKEATGARLRSHASSDIPRPHNPQRTAPAAGPTLDHQPHRSAQPRQAITCTTSNPVSVIAPPSPRLLYMHATRQIRRRTVPRATGAAAVGLAGVAPSVAAGGAFAHPDLRHAGADLARMAAKVKAGAAPYIAECAKPTANPHSQSGCTARPRALGYRGVELRLRSTWPRSYGRTRQPVRILCSHGWTQATSMSVNPSHVSAKIGVPYFERRLKSRTM